MLAMSLMFWTLTRIINSFGPLFPYIRGFADSLDGKESAYIVGDLGSDPWIGKVPWRKAWQPTPVFLPGEFHGQLSLVATVHRVAESDTTETTNTFTPLYKVSFSKILQFYNACHPTPAFQLQILSDKWLDEILPDVM